MKWRKQGSQVSHNLLDILAAGRETLEHQLIVPRYDVSGRTGKLLHPCYPQITSLSRSKTGKGFSLHIGIEMGCFGGDNDRAIFCFDAHDL